MDDENQRLFTIFAQSAATRGGEPWMTFFETAKLTRRLEELGFAQIKNLSPGKRTLVTLPAVVMRSAFPAWNI